MERTTQPRPAASSLPTTQTTPALGQATPDHVWLPLRYSGFQLVPPSTDLSRLLPPTAQPAPAPSKVMPVKSLTCGRVDVGPRHAVVCAPNHRAGTAHGPEACRPLVVDVVQFLVAEGNRRWVPARTGVGRAIDSGAPRDRPALLLIGEGQRVDIGRPKGARARVDRGIGAAGRSSHEMRVVAGDEIAAGRAGDGVEALPSEHAPAGAAVGRGVHRARFVAEPAGRRPATGAVGEGEIRRRDRRHPPAGPTGTSRHPCRRCARRVARRSRACSDRERSRWRRPRRCGLRPKTRHSPGPRAAPCAPASSWRLHRSCDRSCWSRRR